MKINKITLKDMEEEIKKGHKENPEMIMSLSKWKKMCKEHDKRMKTYKEVKNTLFCLYSWYA